MISPVNQTLPLPCLKPSKASQATRIKSKPATQPRSPTQPDPACLSSHVSLYSPPYSHPPASLPSLHPLESTKLILGRCIYQLSAWLLSSKYDQAPTCAGNPPATADMALYPITLLSVLEPVHKVMQFVCVFIV